MKRLLLIFVAVCLTVAQVAAQDPVFSKGDKVLNLALGIGSTLYSGSFYKGTIPPISGSLEFGVVDNVLEKGSVGVGPYVGFSGYKYHYFDYTAKYTNIIIGARGAFHYPLLNKLDTYTGLLLGYDIVSFKETGFLTGYNASSSGIAWSWFVGGRYWFTNNLAGLLELGYGIAYLNLGVALKF